MWTSLLLFGIGALSLLTNEGIILKFYPLIMNILFLGAFGLTLFYPPSMIYRFAILQDKTIPKSPGEKSIAGYCRKVTKVWIAFFIFNGTMAALTIFSGSDSLWSFYNGGVSYMLIGLLFAGEFIVRKRVQKAIPKAVPLTAFRKKSRDISAVLCYEGVFSDGLHKTWGDFLKGTAILCRQIKAIENERWLLYCEDSWFFLLAFTSLLQCKKEVILTANSSPAYIAEIRGGALILTDKAFREIIPLANKGSKDIYLIPELLEANAGEENNMIDALAEAPLIIGDETSIIMFTSGSTGKPKAVKQRLTELESDNRFILSKWGEGFIKRKLCSTVNHHHIYGLLFSILLPFTIGIPFRRKMVQFPEELEKFSDTEYMIITVPAFLKRAVEIETPSRLRLKSPWIFTSGGVLDPGVAEKTSEVFGFWPLEVYGSTETSGIAWRQSDKGPEWTVFDNARISANNESCLVVRSPYIKDPEGFATADMVEILVDGRFILKGRMDSVVKIEEKRISFTELESRIFDSGLVSDACVIALEGKRQYLAAALVFNDKGRVKFAGSRKHEINSFWREYLLQFFENMVIPKKWRYIDALPVNAQGKKMKDDIKLLFSKEKQYLPGFSALDGLKIVEKSDKAIALEFSIPPHNPYFDGHFPEFSLLPAVAQMELIIRFASEYFGTGIDVKEMRRIKFTKFIRPHAPLSLRLEKGEKNITFKIISREDDSVCSSGIFAVCEGNSK